ncbi:hypothetical protein D3C80_1406000 [compost metagenome]
MPPVLHPAVALDRRHDNSAGKAQQVDQHGDQQRLPEGERRDETQEAANQGRQGNTTDKAFDGFRRRQVGGDLALAKELAAHVLQHVRQLHDDHQVGDQQQVVPLEPGNIQRQQCRHERHAEHRDHQPPLHFRGALEKVRAVAAQ